MCPLEFEIIVRGLACILRNFKVTWCHRFNLAQERFNCEGLVTFPNILFREFITTKLVRSLGLLIFPSVPVIERLNILLFISHLVILNRVSITMILPLKDTFIHSTCRDQILLTLRVFGEHQIGDV